MESLKRKNCSSPSPPSPSKETRSIPFSNDSVNNQNNILKNNNSNKKPNKTTKNNSDSSIATSHPNHTSHHTILDPAHQKLKRRKPRCSSPSHFYTEFPELQQYSETYKLNLPNMAPIESMLNAVGSLYYRPQKICNDDITMVFDDFNFPTIDFLCSPLRKPSLFDKWNMNEIALFESSICSLGKDFPAIQKIIKTKTVGEIVDFYYFWKKSSHYDMWKYYGKAFSRSVYSESHQTISNLLADF